MFSSAWCPCIVFLRWACVSHLVLLFYLVKFAFTYIVVNFVLNYIVSALYLLFPLIFYFSLKSLFLCVINFVTFTLAIMQIRSSSSKQRTLAWLFLSHFFVSIIFEPDLGSYLRHQSIFMLIIFFPLIDTSRFKQFISISPSSALKSSASL